MSLKAQTVCPVPQETARIARAAFPKGNAYMQILSSFDSVRKGERVFSLDFDMLVAERPEMATRRASRVLAHMRINSWKRLRPLAMFCGTGS
jgi:hypothetical protein